MSTIIDKLNSIYDIKQQMRDAILEKGGSVSENEPFGNYAEDILNIPVAGELDVRPLYATENGRYIAESGVGYNPLSVQVPLNIDIKNVNENGVYTAEDDALDGYSIVKVEIPDPKPKTGELTINASVLPQQIEPATFDAKDANLEAYSKVNVDISGKLIEKTMTVDTDGEAEQIIYDPTEENRYGCSKFTILLKEKEGPFRVEFWNRSSLLQVVDNVPKYGSAQYTGDVPTADGYEFKGWNPQPVRVTTNLKCYAEFENKEDMEKNRQDSGGGGGSEYSGNWKDIAATGGADLPIGTTIDVFYGPFTADFGVSLKGGRLQMKKVYSGESGTTSTWLSTEGLPITAASFGYSLDTGGWNKSWTDSKLYSVLNGAFLSALGAMSGADFKESSAVVQAIKQVPKPTIGISQYSDPQNPKTWYIKKETAASQSIWIPSAQEYGSSSYEENGVVYTARPKAGNLLMRTASEPERILVNAYSPDYDGWDKQWSGKVVASAFHLLGERKNYKGLAWGTYDAAYASAYKEHYGREFPNKWETEPITNNIIIGFCT